MNDFINDKVLPKVMGFINTKAMRALKDGILYSMPLLIIGSIFLLLAYFPFTPLSDWFAEVGITPILNQAYGSTFNIMSFAVVVGIAYTYAKNDGQPGLSAGIIALSCFLILQPSSITDIDGNQVDVILKAWTAGQGMICAIVVGLLTGWVFSFFMNRNIVIKMPEGVPAGVVNAFTSLIPGAVMIIGTVIIYAAFSIGLQTTFVEWIYTTIQTPMQGVTDSIGGVIVIALAIPFLWFFGVHGSMVVEGVMMPLLQANAQANQAILDAGKELTLENGAHIVTVQFYEEFMVMCGAGVTIGIVIYMLFLAKSTQYKSIGKLGFGPALFNINEPVLFGTPVVLNPMLAIPFLIMPLITGVLEYFAIYFGLCPLYAGIIVPWTTPPVISGLLVGDWRTAVLQILIIGISVLIYLPFIHKADRLAYQNEQDAAIESRI